MSEERIIPRGFIGKHILAVPEREYRKELAAEFRAAVVAAQLERVSPESRTCDWCGKDLYTVDDHKTIDRDFFMCNPCQAQYFDGLER